MNPLNVVMPNKRLAAKERRVFDRVVSEFAHLKQSDADMIARYSEAFIRYETAAAQVKRYPMVQKPTINRSTGNVVGTTPVRNPLFRTVAEAQSQMNSLARRLLIDAASENRRLSLQSKKARSAAAVAAESATRYTEEEIEREALERAKRFPLATAATLRQLAIDVFDDFFSPDWDDPELEYLGLTRPSRPATLNSSTN